MSATLRPIGRRGALLGAGGLALARVARADGDRVRCDIGSGVFMVPRPYLFAEVMPPGLTTDGLPPRFSFAFLMPDGEPAGEGLEFPPMSHPFEVERASGRYLVMCYRVMSATDKSVVLPTRELPNLLSETRHFEFASLADLLVIKWRLPPGKDDDNVQNVYDSTYYSAEKFDASCLLLHSWAEAEFYMGRAASEKVGVTFQMFLPAKYIEDCTAVMLKAFGSLNSWKA